MKYGIEIVSEGGTIDTLWWREENDRDRAMDHIDTILDESYSSIRIYADSQEWVGNKFKFVCARSINADTMDEKLRRTLEISKPRGPRQKEDKKEEKDDGLPF